MTPNPLALKESPLTQARQQAAIHFLSDHRYLILGTLLFALMLSRTVNGQWDGDFWEHSAVVRELATHPFAPQHPQLLLAAPHAFFTPYALVLGWVSRLTGWDAISTLALAGLVNLLLFLYSLRAFVSALLNSAAAFYTLLLLLLLWGISPWYYSGFFHLGALGFVLPYPSTFATALVLLSFSIVLR